MSNIKDNLLYTKNHEWVLIEDGVATIGITDYAQSQLGDIVFAEIYDDEVLFKDDIIGVIEAVKTASDIFSPLTGEVIEINETTQEDPETINNDPYGLGWLVKIVITREDEIKDLLSPDEYASLISH